MRQSRIPGGVSQPRTWGFLFKSDMTKEELIEKLSELNGEDPELDHIQADNLLLEYINDVEISKAFTKIDKWYA